MVETTLRMRQVLAVTHRLRLIFFRAFQEFMVHRKLLLEIHCNIQINNSMKEKKIHPICQEIEHAEKVAGRMC